jgi:hypothetical protein
MTRSGRVATWRAATVSEELGVGRWAMMGLREEFAVRLPLILQPIVNRPHATASAFPGPLTRSNHGVFTFVRSSG